MKNINSLQPNATFSQPDWLKYFFFMGTAEVEISRLCLAITPKTKKEKDFIKDLKKALKVISPGFWISTQEAGIKDTHHTFSDNTFSNNIQIYFAEGTDIENTLCCFEWKEKATEFAPGWESDLADWYEWILFLAYRIAKKYLTIEFVCNNSSDCTKPSKFYLEPAPSGSREVGGFYDGIGNTRKITKFKSSYALSGPCYYDNDSKRTVASYEIVAPNESNCYASGIIVLRKSLVHQLSLIQTPTAQELETIKNEKLSKAYNTLNSFEKLFASVELDSNSKTVSLIIKKLYEILEMLKHDSSRYIKFVNIFEIYLPEFYSQLELYSNLQKVNAITEREKELLSKSINKFSNFLNQQNFETTLDIDATKIEFNATAKTFLTILDKD